MCIYPLDCNAVPLSAFEPAKNTITQATQPLPAMLPSLLILTPAPSPAVSAAPGPSPHVSVSASASADDASAPVDHDGANPGAPESCPADPIASTADDEVRTEPEPRQQYHIDVPPPLPHSASCRALQEENKMLQDILEQAGVVLEQDYAQMKLMDLQNEWLCQKAFTKNQQKAVKKLASGQARHMTAPEIMDLLA